MTRARSAKVSAVALALGAASMCKSFGDYADPHASAGAGSGGGGEAGESGRGNGGSGETGESGRSGGGNGDGGAGAPYGGTADKTGGSAGATGGAETGGAGRGGDAGDGMTGGSGGNGGSGGDGGNDGTDDPEPGISGVVALFVNGQFACGGTLIANSWVLTADQCVPAMTELGDVSIGYGLDRRMLEQTRSVVEIRRFPGNDGTAAARGRDVLLLGTDAPFVIDGSASEFFHRTSPWHTPILNFMHRCVGWDLVADPLSPTTRLHDATLFPIDIAFGTQNAGTAAGDRLTWRNDNSVDKNAGILPMNADLGTGCFYSIQGQEFLTVIQTGNPMMRLDGSANDRDEATAVSLGDDEIRNWLDATLFDVTENEASFAGPVGSCSFGSTSFEVFGVVGDGGIGWSRFAEGEPPTWVSVDHLDHPPATPLHASKPGVLCNADGSLELVARGNDDTLWWRHRSPEGDWSAWSLVESAQTAVTSGVSVAGVVPGHFHVFARGPSNELRHAEFDGGWTGAWESLYGDTNTPTARMKDREGWIDVFVRSSNDSIWMRTYWLGVWTGWAPFGGFSASEIAVASWGSRWGDLFGRTQAGDLWHLWWGEHPVDSTIYPGISMPAGEPAAISMRPGRTDIVLGQSDGNLWHAFSPRAPRAD